MFDNFLSALEDYIDLRIEQERDSAASGDNRRWHEQIRDRQREYADRMQRALKAYIQSQTP
jgi:hypothetical protein